ncbi:membrane protein [Sinorhizobium meliloti]|nr:membrane protein [Sinorhizobium meliloti]
MIAQVPSERRVMVVPSGRVTVAVAKLSPPEDPLVTEDPALVVADPPLAVVPPPTVVDEDTLPDPTVTDDETPLPSDCSGSMTTQVEPSSSLISFAAAWSGAKAAANSAVITGTRNELEVIGLLLLENAGFGRGLRSQPI